MNKTNLVLLVSLAAALPARAQYTGNNALTFNGTNQFVAVPAIALSNRSFTVETWLRRDTTNRWDLFLSQGTNVNYNGLHIGFRPNNLFTLGFFGSDLDYAAPILDTNWHHWAASFDFASYERRLYLDGALVAQDFPGPYQGSGPLRLASTPFLSSSFFRGSLDELRIWTVARSAGEIQAAYNHTLSGAESNLVLYFRLDATSGSLATNLAAATGAASNGSLFNSPTWGAGAPIFAPPAAVTLSASPAAATAAMLNGTINPDGGATAYYFQYGLTTNYGSVSATNSLTPTNATLNVSSLATSLTPSVLYHFRLVAANGAGTATGADLSFTAGVVPDVITGLAGASNTVATLNGTVNPNGQSTTVWFEYGSIAGHYPQHTASKVLGNDMTSVAVSNTLSGLMPGFIYHCRVVASNAAGLARGRDVPFGSPVITFDSGAALTDETNECHLAFTDLATASGAPLAIAAGPNHSLALKNDGTVVAWGDASVSQTVVPAGLGNVVAIAAGLWHNLALKSDGTVLGMGNNSYGAVTVPAGLSNVLAVATENTHNLALKSDGTVLGWGANNFGQTNIPAGLSNVMAIAAGYDYSLALKRDGTVAAWGNLANGERYRPVDLSNVVAIATKETHSLALKSDGTVVAWGFNFYGETNVPAGLSNVVAVSAGRQHSLALKSDGTVVAWGGQGTGHGGAETNVPSGLSNVVAIAAGTAYSLALKSDGSLVAWGDSSPTNVPPGLMTVKLTVSGSVNTNSPDAYPLSYTSENVFGGAAAATRSVFVQDTLPPVMALLGNNPLLITNASNLPFIDPGATASDLCSGSLSVTASNDVNVNIPGPYTITYRATDASGNTAFATRTVIVALPPTASAVPGDQDGDGFVSQAELDAVYARYLTTSPRLLMTNVAGLGGQQVTFSLSNSVLGVYTVEYTTNLANWQPLGPATPRYEFTDTNAPAAPQRFYRLRYP